MPKLQGRDDAPELKNKMVFGMLIIGVAFSRDEVQVIHINCDMLLRYASERFEFSKVEKRGSLCEDLS